MNNKEKIFHLNRTDFSKVEMEFYCYKKLNDAQTKDWEREYFSFILEWLSPSPTVKVKTSGSTGEPKEILLKKEYMKASALATINFFKLKPGFSALLCLPVKYIAGKMMIVRAFVGGMNLLLTEPNTIPYIKNFQKIDFCAMVPNQIAGFLETNEGTEQLERIQILIVGGSFLPGNLESKIKKLKTSVWQTYGMTETITHIALRKISGENIEELYSPLIGVDVLADERGCLIINDKKIGINRLITNDLAEINKDGKFKILGRIDNVVISGGIKLFPEEIESKLSGWIENDYYLSSTPDEKLGRKLILFIEDSGSLKKQIFHLWEKIETRLNGFEIPKEIIFIDRFNRTDSGKIIRN